MRRSVLSRIALVVAAPAAFAVIGCEDGPNQPYSPAPTGAGSIWNNGGGTTNDPGMQGLNSGGGGTNAVNICTAAQQQQAWSKAFTSPLIPPFTAAGIDLSAGGTFNPVTIEDIEKGLNGNQQLCQGFNGAGFCSDGSGSPGYSWGESNQVNTCYDIATHQVTFFLLLPGYDGEATFTLPAMYSGKPVPAAVAQDGSTGKDLKYVWHIGKPVTENGQVLDLQWGQADGGVTHTKAGMGDKIANKLFLALTYTFNPTLIAVTDATQNPPLNYMTDPGFNCLPRTICRTSMNPDGSGGNYGARTVALYADFALSNATDKASAASPSDIYMYPVKYMPYSFSTYNVGLDTFVGKNTDPSLQYKGAPIYGAYTPAGVLSPPAGTQTPFCTLYMGQNWGDFKKACLDVSGDANTDKTTLNKILGAQHHAAEWFTFSVNGQNQNFSADAAELAPPNYVLADSEHEPPADSLGADLFNDIRSYGVPLNDLRGDQYPASPAVTPLDHTEDVKMQGQDMHGTAAIMGYFRQLVFDDIRAQMVAFGITPQTEAAIESGACWTGGKGLGYVFPDGCTGFEMMVTATPPLGLPDTKWQDQMDLGPYPYGLFAPTVFRSGDPVVDFMGDPSFGLPDDTFISNNFLVQGSLLEVQYVTGHGNLNLVPPAARDWRYYFIFWAQAYTKYMLNRSKNPTWHDLYANTCGGVANGCRPINQDALFFDLNNGLDKFEYIDRTPSATLGSPVDFEYNVLITSTNVQSMNFYQRLTRAESAMYQAMLPDKTKVPGSNENVNLSDLFGSPAMASSYIPTLGAGTQPGHDAYYCATTTPQDPDCPNGPPTDRTGAMLVDGLGRPLFTNYHGLFTGTAFSIGNTLPITQTLPYVLGALVNVPNYANPYDLTSKNTPINVFIPHLLSQPGVGFEIPINAQRSQFIQTGSLDFSGVTVTMNVDYLPVYDPMSGALTGGQIAAVETQDFLGEVWPCVDATTGDILRVKMYSSALDIQNWFDAHPGSRTACNIFVRQSPYNNWPDYIWSTTNGVLLSINPGAGGGPPRVSDATLFNPSLLTQTQ
jgi:hypothetical protein